MPLIFWRRIYEKSKIYSRKQEKKENLWFWDISKEWYKKPITNEPLIKYSNDDYQLLST